MKKIIFILLIFSASNAFAQSALSNENSITGSELNSLRNEMKVVEKNNDKYRDFNGTGNFIQFYSKLSQLFSAVLGNNNSPLSVGPAKVQALSPDVVSDGSEIYTQKIFFRYTANQRRQEQISFARRKAMMLRKRRPSVGSNFASSLEYNL